MHTKFIFVTGGVVSSLGKGISASALGTLLEHQGYSVALMKFDPYLNIDPGTMSPYQHGEVYVTQDGMETDLDLGHYFRFTNSPLCRKSNATSGQIYHEVIKRERRGDYLGKTVQTIPHITDEIKHRILECAHQKEGIDFLICEIGGTVGDIESLPFLEAIRQFRYERPKQCLNLHVTYVPFINAAGEVKTKPTQHSVQALREIGLFPDFILCRCEEPLSDEVKEKISLFSNVPKEHVIEATDVTTTVYEIPISFHEQQFEDKVCAFFNLPSRAIDLSIWTALVESIKQPRGVVTIGVVGKYVQHQDAYKSVFESLTHAATSHGYSIEIQRIEPDKFADSDSFPEWAKNCDGYLVPGGFGDRGWKGKLLTAKYCRENKIPYFGICLGMQVAAVEFARNVVGLQEANSTEMDSDTQYPIISLLDEQRIVTERGGTMRLGAYSCHLKKSSKAYAAYGTKHIQEIHRHRYELNNKFSDILRQYGMELSGICEEGDLCEIVEIVDHPWMVGVQFHPEFLSKPTAPHPLFCDFIQAAVSHKNAMKSVPK